MDALAETVKAGKVRRVGVSNYGADQMRQAHDRLASHGVALASNQWSTASCSGHRRQTGCSKRAGISV
jgi:aryl-alcohol dehydrogenase-like predicted oxidoreductase